MRALMNRVASLNSVVKVVVADMNGDPKISPQRFKALKKKGFDLFAPIGSPTNVDPQVSKYEHLWKRLDYIAFQAQQLSKWRIIAFFQNLFKAAVRYTTGKNAGIPSQIFWDKKNCSDHRPVYLEIGKEQIPSGVSRFGVACKALWHKVFG
jgi:hypothetical protein